MLIRRNNAAMAALFVASAIILTQAGTAQSVPTSEATAAVSGATQEATKMVPATAVFVSNMNSQKLTAGTTIKAKLQKSVHLSNGSVLPGGTILVGQVVNDTTETGKAKLAMRFTEAELKGGQAVPVKVTVFGLFQVPSASSVTDNFSSPKTWDNQSLGISQVDVLPGVDLHSAIESPNSAVLVSTKDAIKLTADHGISFAIAPRSGSADQSANGY